MLCECSYAVFPEHLEVITSSNLLKVVGNIAGDMVVVEGRPRLSGWAMIMPEKLAESTGGNSQNAVGKEDPGIVAELLKWVVGECSSILRWRYLLLTGNGGCRIP